MILASLLATLRLPASPGFASLQHAQRSAAGRLCTAAGPSDGAYSGSVSRIIYAASDDQPRVRLFTKAGCTLCDKAKMVLQEVVESHPHTLEAVDITDAEHAKWWAKYKYDIPVLHIDDAYWTKHRLNREEAEQALAEAEGGSSEPRRGQPGAERMERKK